MSLNGLKNRRLLSCGGPLWYGPSRGPIPSICQDRSATLLERPRAPSAPVLSIGAIQNLARKVYDLLGTREEGKGIAANFKT